MTEKDGIQLELFTSEQTQGKTKIENQVGEDLTENLINTGNEKEVQLQIEFS